MRRVLPRVEYRRHKGLNSRAGNSHLPMRQRERRMHAALQVIQQAQRFLGAFHRGLHHFSLRRHVSRQPPTAS